MMDNKCLTDYGVKCNTNLFLCPRLVGGGTPKFYLDNGTLDEHFNYDFTNMRDDGTKFYRGGKPYYRPYGWDRYALKVRGKHEDDMWLGDDGIHTYSCPGEWPVAYHGTTEDNCRSIAQEGYDFSKGKRFLYGIGIYIAPSIDFATRFATKFTSAGKEYKVVFQNSVSTKDLREVKNQTGDEYWGQPHPELVRPYGICVKLVPTNATQTRVPSTSDNSCTIL